MATSLIDNFSYKGKQFLDSRQSVATLAALKAIPESEIPDGFKAFVASEGKWYQFRSTNTSDATSGKWRIDSVEMKQDTGDSEEFPMSQKAVTDNLNSLTRNRIFSEVTGAEERMLQDVFIDACVKTDQSLENVYYTFGLLSATEIRVCAVDMQQNVRPEWDSFVKLLDIYTFVDTNPVNGALTAVPASNPDCYIIVDAVKYGSLVKSSISKWDWKIDGKHYLENRGLNRISTLVSEQNKLSGMTAHASRNRLFSEVTGKKETLLQDMFVDVCVTTDDAISDAYYSFSVIKENSISFYAVDNGMKPRPEWGNYIKLIRTYYRDNLEPKDGALYFKAGTEAPDDYLIIDAQKFKDLVSGDITGLYGFKIDKKYFIKSRGLNNNYCLHKNTESLTAIEGQVKRHDSAISDVSEAVREICGVSADESKAVHQLGTATKDELTVGYTSSIFCGFRTSIGKVDTPFNFVQLPVICRSVDGSENPIRRLTLYFFEINAGAWGDCLFEQTFDVNVPVGEIFDSILKLKQTLDFSEYDEIGIGYDSDTYSSFMNYSGIVDSGDRTGTGQFRTLYSDGTITKWDRGTITRVFKNYYYKLFRDLEHTVIISESTLAKIKADVSDATRKSLNSIEISLPNKIYAVVGDTLQIFFRGCVRAVNPYNYDILVTCSKGNKYPRYFTYTPKTTDIGETPFKITVRDNNGNVLGEKGCTIVTRSPKSPSTSLNVACFGDSLTAGSGGAWCAEAHRRLTGSGGTPEGDGLSNIAFKGQMTGSHDTGYFGVGGWSWNEFVTGNVAAFRFVVSGVTSLSVGSVYENSGHEYTVMEVNVTQGSGNILCRVNSSSHTPEASGSLVKKSGSGDENVSFSSFSQDSANPLFNDGRLSFIPYADKYCDGHIDVVYTLLSWNALADHQTDFSTILGKVKTFADKLHEEFPEAKLKLLGMQVPSVNGGMGANYGATGSGYADGYGMLTTVFNMNDAFQDFARQEGYSDFVEFVNVSTQFDTENNMPVTEAKVNTRCDTKEIIGTNGVHPYGTGQLQIADVVYRNFIASFCQ